METIKRGVIAIAALCLLVSYPQELKAKKFTSAEFLTWPHESQSSYFRTSIGMAGMIAAQAGQGRATCMSDWYFGDPEGRQEEMRRAMRQHKGFHPQAVILAVLQKACGPIGGS